MPDVGRPRGPPRPNVELALRDLLGAAALHVFRSKAFGDWALWKNAFSRLDHARYPSDPREP
jgi:hypothetical protein